MGIIRKPCLFGVFFLVLFLLGGCQESQLIAGEDTEKNEEAPTTSEEKTQADFYQQLLAYHAPIVLQETANIPKGDAITRFDFDGDWNGNNNWKNLKHFSTPAFVYGGVIESQRFYFLTYAFFHPRDYSDICLPYICHENDLEGAIFTIRKDQTPFGQFFVGQAFAHNQITTKKAPVRINPSTMEKDPQGQVALRIESSGHGVYFSTGTWPKKTLIYTHGLVASNPGGQSQGTFTYQFLQIQSLWNKRSQIGKESVFQRTYRYKGARMGIPEPIPHAFAGTRYGKGLAQPPWAWKAGRLARGDWFLDPLLAIKPHAPDWSNEEAYLFHPYFDIFPEDEEPDPMPQPSPEFEASPMSSS